MHGTINIRLLEQFCYRDRISKQNICLHQFFTLLFIRGNYLLREKVFIFICHGKLSGDFEICYLNDALIIIVKFRNLGENAQLMKTGRVYDKHSQWVIGVLTIQGLLQD